MSYSELITEILLSSPEEQDKEITKVTDYAKCWSEALSFSLGEGVRFDQWYIENKDNLH